MMEAFITPEIFRQGLKIYLSKHKFRNTKPSDLWSAIEEANKVSNSYIDVEAVMNNWIKQAGYPIVTVKRLGGNQFELTQQRFVVSSGQNDSDLKFNKTVWNIPLTYATKSENMSEAEKRIIWMNDENLRLPINVGEGEWYAINLRQTGFYRVNYDMENWKILTETLIRNHQEIPRLMRAQLIDDNFRISKIPSSLTPTVFCTALRYGGATEFDYLKKMMAEALHEEEKHRIIEAMGCTQDFGLFKSFIFGLMDDTSQKYDELELPTTLNGNPVALYALYDILKREFPNRRESFNFTLILRSIEKRGIYIDMLPIREELIHMNLTLSRESDKTAERAMNRILRQSNRHQMWLSRNANTIHKWLKQELGDHNVPSQPTFSQSVPSRSTTGAEITA
ncbi:unnamed protein product [Hymenolepis diminuta]|uniref:Peptidase_M1 domain-containing protein n=1 Tax=Hymenolepis diminuta TaxID=6216 RepID=A0A0R3SWG1_HYMDI|nr:unnamed protein product [Hymenolepis diminuta]